MSLARPVLESDAVAVQEEKRGEVETGYLAAVLREKVFTAAHCLQRNGWGAGTYVEGLKRGKEKLRRLRGAVVNELVWLGSAENAGVARGLRVELERMEDHELFGAWGLCEER